MKFNTTKTTIIALAVLLSSNLSLAATDKVVPQQAAPSKATKSAASTKSAKAVAAPKAKLVDINSAPSTELQRLPGINDATAAKIIAGRPYGSKAWLVTNQVIDRAVYDNIKTLVVAKQTKETIAKIAALHDKKK